MRHRRWPPPGEVHLFWLRLPRRGAARRAAVLSDPERRRAEAIPSPERRARFVACRAGVRTILARYLGCAPADVPIAAGPHGKPFLPRTRALRFNVTHSRGRAVLAVAVGRALGVDLERVRQDVDCDRVAGEVFAPAEERAFRALPERLRRRAFFIAWTRKEAVIKAKGDRAALAPHAFEVGTDPRRPPRVARGLSLRALEAPRGYVACLATHAPVRVRVVEPF
jgi:4'-phosphopantetheinyl transferase